MKSVLFNRFNIVQFYSGNFNTIKLQTLTNKDFNIKIDLSMDKLLTPRSGTRVVRIPVDSMYHSQR
tara:strand:+ start:227 stop:424 length:198 start_codon:yes stop_codon:yes gene_type:complete